MVSAVAGVGIAVNVVTALLFARGRKGDINIRGAYLHMVADALVSAGVVVAGLAICGPGRRGSIRSSAWSSSALIFWQTWGLLRETVEMALAAVPRGIDFDAVEGGAARRCRASSAVHDLHIWPMSTTETVLTAHLVMPGGDPAMRFPGGAAGHAARAVRDRPCDVQVERRRCAVVAEYKARSVAS